MNIELWSELGIDCKKFEKELTSKRNKGLSLQNKISDDVFYYLKERLRLSEAFKKDALNNIWATQPELLKDIYLLSCCSNNFNEDMVKKYGMSHFRLTSQKSVLFLLIKSLVEDTELLRKMHYASLLASKKLISAKPNVDVSETAFDALDEDKAENYARKYFTSKTKQLTVNVWYLLNDNDSVTVFIYKNCKSNAKVASTQKRKYQFVPHSRPIILRFSKDGKNLDIFAKPAQEQGLNMASSIASCLLSTPTNQVNVIYAHKEEYTDEGNLNLLLKDCLNEKDDCPFALQELTCKPNENLNDFELVFIKHRDSLKDMVKKIEDALDAKIAIKKVSEIKIKFKEYQITMNFRQGIDDQYLVTYSHKSTDLPMDRELKNKMKRDYGIILLRKG